jgi:protein-L-isoaspartate(D-aspartate) O-methyltransferase
MAMTDDAAVRRWYAEDLRLRAPVRRNMAIVEAFAAVPRERFLGPPPWRLLSDRRPGEPFDAPDAAAHWVYHDVLVTIDAARRLNNGSPSLWAATFDQLELQPGRRVLQVGAGTGYYAAVLAEIVGPDGRVVAVECDEALAARAREGLAPWSQVELVHGDGCTHDAGEVDVIIVCAGATHPAPLWLDRLAPGGQLLMPLTTRNQWGFLLRVTRGRDLDGERIVLPRARRSNQFDATSIGPVGIFPCTGGRDEEAAARLEAALIALRRTSWLAEVPIAGLYRGAPSGDDVGRVWYAGPGFWLARKADA